MTRIRPLIEEDFSFVLEWENTPELWRVSEQTGPFTEQEIYDFMKRCLDVNHTEIERWVILDEQHPIGALDIFDMDMAASSCGLGIFITHAQDRLKGHATHALREGIHMLKVRGCKLVKALIYADNETSIRLFEKAEFQRAGDGFYKGKTVYHYYKDLGP
jgi:RimJ/RimL family protein N-acetyltransferase